MSIERGIDDADPIRSQGIGHVEERRTTSSILAVGTLACPECDAPVAPPERRICPADPLACPYCLHHGAARDFLSLGEPTRPARVVVRLIRPARLSASGRGR